MEECWNFVGYVDSADRQMLAVEQWMIVEDSEMMMEADQEADWLGREVPQRALAHYCFPDTVDPDPDLITSINIFYDIELFRGYSS